MNHDELVGLLEQKRVDQGLTGVKIQVSAIKPSDGYVGASINLQKWDVQVDYDPSWKPDLKTLKYAQAHKIATPDQAAVVKVYEHEIAHWQHCPYDIYHHDIMLEATGQGLADAGLSEDIQEEHTHYVCNMFQDLIANVNIQAKEESPEFYILFYKDEDEPYQALYECHIKLHDRFFGQKSYTKLVEQSYNVHAHLDPWQGRQISEQVDKTVDTIVNNVLRLKGKDVRRSAKLLGMKSAWSYNARKFAEQVAPLLELGGKKAKKKGSKPTDNPFDKMMEDPEVQKKIVQRRKSQGKPMPRYMKHDTSYDHLYQLLADEIVVKSLEKGHERKRIKDNVATHEVFNPEEHTFSQLDLSRITFDPECQMGDDLGFEVPELYHSRDIITQRDVVGLPDIMFVFDTSGSMMGSPGQHKIPWETGAYHSALIGIYNTLNWLKKEQIAHLIKYNLTYFASTSASSGWQTYAGMKTFKHWLFNPDSSGTNLDIEVLNEQLENKSRSAVIMFSDGGIFNFRRIKNPLHRLMQKHLFSYVETGGWGEGSEIFKAAKSWGCPAIKADKPSDLKNIVLDLTQQSYKGFL